MKSLPTNLALYLISKFLVTITCDNTASQSDWPCTFLQPGCFCLASIILFEKAQLIHNISCKKYI